MRGVGGLALAQTRRTWCTPGQMQLFDCFVFGQREAAILNLRIDTTCGLVDYTIIATGTSSHSSISLTKPHLTRESLAMLRARCPSTPIHLVRVDTAMPPNVRKNRSWLTLLVQMNGLAIKARDLGMQPSDVLVVSEHDEIPTPQLLRSLRASDGLGRAPATAKLRTSLFYFYHAGCYGGHEWNAGFVANGAALNLQVGKDRHSGKILPPTAAPPNFTWPEAADSDGQVVIPQNSQRAPYYPYIDLMTLRLGFTNRVSGLDKHRAAVGSHAATGGLIPKVQLSQGFGADGFPPPHVLPNASWHLSTFMDPADVLSKLRFASHTECNIAPYNTLEYQARAQQTCAHFCKSNSTLQVRTHQRALLGKKDPKPSIIADPAALDEGAYPAAICHPEFRRFASEAWCARWRSSFGTHAADGQRPLTTIAPMVAVRPAASPEASTSGPAIRTQDGGVIAQLRAQLVQSDASIAAMRLRLARAEEASSEASAAALRLRRIGIHSDGRRLDASFQSSTAANRSGSGHPNSPKCNVSTSRLAADGTCEPLWNPTMTKDGMPRRLAFAVEMTFVGTGVASCEWRGR